MTARSVIIAASLSAAGAACAVVSYVRESDPVAAVLICAGWIAAVAMVFAHERTLRRAGDQLVALADPEATQNQSVSLPAPLTDAEHAIGGLKSTLSQTSEDAVNVTTTITHQLKGPISAIAGAAELLDEPGLQSEQYQLVQTIRLDCARMNTMVSKILELARARYPLPESIHQVSVEHFMHKLASSYGRALQLHVLSPPATIAINPIQLETAIRNLIDNAVRHGAGKLVQLTVGSVGRKLFVEVRDQGTGIASEHRNRLFRPFFTTERDRGGTGLGLAIVKAVVDSQGGDIRVESNSRGTAFRLTL